MPRTLPGTRALRTLEAAGRHLNFTRAAEEIGLTPAAVSYQIKEIEAQLGLQLFTRSGRSLRLTPAGALLHEAASEALAGLERALGRARRLTRGAGELRLSLGARVAASWLLPRLPLLKTAHPGLALAFDITDQVRDFERDEVDAAIRFGAGRYAGLRSLRLFDTRVVAVCGPRLLQAGPRPEQPRDLLGHRLYYLDRRAEGAVWPTWRHWMAAAGIEDFDDSRCLAFSDSSHLVQAVVEGEGVGLADLPLIEPELTQGRLLRLFDIALAVARDYAYHLVYPESRSADPRLLALTDWLLAQARPPAPPAPGA